MTTRLHANNKSSLLSLNAYCNIVSLTGVALISVLIINTYKVFSDQARMDLWLGLQASWLASKSFNSRQQTDLWQLVCMSCGYLPIVSYDQLLGLMPQQAYVPYLMLLTVTCGVVQWSATDLYKCNASNWQSDDTMPATGKVMIQCQQLAK